MNKIPQALYNTRRHPAGEIITQNKSSSQRFLEIGRLLGIEVEPIIDTRLLRCSFKGREAYIFAQYHPSNSPISVVIVENKQSTKVFLEKAGVSVAKGYLILRQDTLEQRAAVFQDLEKPLVLKTTSGNKGREVVTGVENWEDFQRELEILLEKVGDSADAGVVCEETFFGQEYRIMATDEKVLSITKRIPANVTGDGRHTIAELIEIKNQDYDRDHPLYFKLCKIEVNDETREFLAKQNLNLESIIPNQTRIFLTDKSNLSQGGDPIDVTKEAHPSVKEIAVRAIQAIPGLKWGGLDLMTKDITQPQTAASYIILEINASAALTVPDLPEQGAYPHIVEEFFKIIFPDIDYP